MLWAVIHPVSDHMAVEFVASRSPCWQMKGCSVDDLSKTPAPLSFSRTLAAGKIRVVQTEFEFSAQHRCQGTCGRHGRQSLRAAGRTEADSGSRDC